MALLSRQRVFTLWFGIGFPLILAGTFFIAFRTDVFFGIAVTAVVCAWFYETGRTTCSRCAYSGTAKCGLPGLIAPLVTRRRSPATISAARIRRHLHLDLCMLLFLNVVYCLEPWLLPIMVIWSVGAWRIAVVPKRYHGLLYRLRVVEERGSQAKPGVRPVIVNDARLGAQRK